MVVVDNLFNDNIVLFSFPPTKIIALQLYSYGKYLYFVGYLKKLYLMEIPTCIQILEETFYGLQHVAKF